MAVEAGPGIAAVASTPISIGGEMSATTPALNSFSSFSGISEFSNFTLDSPVSSIQGFYAIEGAGTGINEGPVSSFDLSSYQTIIQAPEVTLTEKSGLEPFESGSETSPFSTEPLIYNPSTAQVEDLSFIDKEPDLPGLADINFSLPSRGFLDDASLHSNAPAPQVPQGVAESLENINLDPDVAVGDNLNGIDQTASGENFTENKILYSELKNKTALTDETMMPVEAKETEVAPQAEEIIKRVKELDLTEDQTRKVEAAVLEGTDLDQRISDLSAEVFPEADVIDNEPLVDKPLMVVEEAKSGEVIPIEVSAKTPEQIQIEETIRALSIAGISSSEIQLILEPVARSRGFAITEVEEEEALDEELSESEVQKLQAVLIGVQPEKPQSLETPTKVEQRTQGLVIRRLQQIQRLHLRRAEREAQNRVDALTEASKQTFELRNKDSADKPKEVSGAEIVVRVNAPEEKVNSPINPEGPEEGWALTLTRFAHQEFDSPEAAAEFARRLVYEEIQPVTVGESPNPPVSIEEYLLAISKRRSPKAVVNALQSQLPSLPIAA